jgi:hypothetical protein
MLNQNETDFASKITQMEFFFELNSHIDYNKHSKITRSAKHNYSYLHIIKYSSGPLTESLGPSENNLFWTPCKSAQTKNLYTTMERISVC